MGRQATIMSAHFTPLMQPQRSFYKKMRMFSTMCGNASLSCISHECSSHFGLAGGRCGSSPHRRNRKSQKMQVCRDSGFRKPGGASGDSVAAEMLL